MISYINTKNFKYVDVDGKYYMSIQLEKFNFEFDLLNYLNTIYSIDNVAITHFIKKIDKENFKKKLTMKIGNDFVEMNSSKKSHINYYSLKKYNNELLKLKEDITTSNINVYSLDICIIISDYNLEKLNIRVNQIITLLFNIEIKSSRMNFSQLDGFKALLPQKNLKEKMYITSESFAMAYPFLENGIDDSNGLYLGKSNGINININYNNKEYKNTNTLILGSSGTGKSYLMKSILLKNIEKGYIQVVIDAEGEYVNIASKLKNEFEIIEFNCKKNEICYDNQNRAREMQVVKKVSRILSKNKSIILNFSKLSNDEISNTFSCVFNEINHCINDLSRKNKVVIYIDEIWKYISNNENNKQKIINVFKTIRKRNGIIIVATQEIEDVFSNSENDFGISILNNSNFKFIFSNDYLDNVLLSNLSIKKSVAQKLQAFPKGTCLARIGEKEFTLDINTFEYERKIIDGK